MGRKKKLAARQKTGCSHICHGGRRPTPSLDDGPLWGQPPGAEADTPVPSPHLGMGGGVQRAPRGSHHQRRGGSRPERRCAGLH